MFKVLRVKLSNINFSIRTKLLLSFSAIIAVLLGSTSIAVIEYSNMNNYVSSLLSANVNNISEVLEIKKVNNQYITDLWLYLSSEEKEGETPRMDYDFFERNYQKVKSNLPKSKLHGLSEELYINYLLCVSKLCELRLVENKDRKVLNYWFKNELQPNFDRLQKTVDQVALSLHEQLLVNTSRFDRGFYRSIIPGIVAIGVAILLILLLLFFIIMDYVNPLRKMSRALYNFRAFDKKYNLNFEGDDELVELNRNIQELTNENAQKSKLIRSLKVNIKRVDES